MEEKPADQLRAELANRVALIMGSAENRTTAIPALTLYRHTAPTPRASVTYEPSAAFVVQGRKRVELGGTTFIYDSSRFLLTSLDLPVVSQVTEASVKIPYLCLRLKLGIPIIREFLGREELRVPLAPSYCLAMTTAETRVEFLSAFCRILDLLNSPQDIPFLSPLIEREIVYRILQSAEGQRLRSIATVGDQRERTAKVIAWIAVNYAVPLRIEDLAHVAA